MYIYSRKVIDPIHSSTSPLHRFPAAACEPYKRSHTSSITTRKCITIYIIRVCVCARTVGVNRADSATVVGREMYVVFAMHNLWTTRAWERPERGTRRSPPRVCRAEIFAGDILLACPPRHFHTSIYITEHKRTIK